MHPTTASPPRRAGFTLIELLLAVTLGSVLLVAMAAGAGVFGAQVHELGQGEDSELRAALCTLADAVRYAWWAEVPSERRLVLADPDGAETAYAFDGGQLLVTRPGGASGVLLEGLSAVRFTAESVTRYRDQDPIDRAAVLWSSPTPGGSPAPLLVDAGARVALGFLLDSAAPAGSGTVPGVEEQLVQAQPGALGLALAAVSPVSVGGTLRVSLHRSRGPHDARPEGAALASTTLGLGLLPVVSGDVIDTKTRRKVKAGKGAAWGWWKKFGTYSLSLTAPTTSIALDLSGLAAAVPPGQACTLVLEPSGSGVVLASWTLASAAKSGVALDGGAGYASQALAVPRSLSGQATLTRTASASVVRRVLVTLVDEAGHEVHGSATLLGQDVADDAWLGVVPGEVDA